MDAAILSALFRSCHLSATEKLCLALSWNRADIARSEIFVYGQEWQEGALDDAMMEALVNNRIEFVKLLLETGVQMAKFLTIPRLEELYNSKQGTAFSFSAVLSGSLEFEQPKLFVTLFLYLLAPPSLLR